MLPDKIHRIIFLIGTGLLVIGMPVSYFLLSLAQIILVVNWLTELNLQAKFKQIKKRKAILFLFSIYALHIIFLLNTQDFKYALHDIRIKLPLLALPIIYGTTTPLSRKEFKVIMALLVATVVVSSLISSYILLGFSGVAPVDSRYASLFISHIRFSLIVVLSIFILLYFSAFDSYNISNSEKITCFITIAWLICFLLLLRSFTGVVIFLSLLPITILWWSNNQNKSEIALFARIASILVVVLIIIYSVSSFSRFNKKDKVNENELLEYTLNGNRYMHNINRDEYENGHHVWLNVSEIELKEEWNKLSSFKYDSTDQKDQNIRNTLIRYLTSLGYTKDSAGISKLSREDIAMIEKGYTNHIFKRKFALYPRIYELLWEIDRYYKSGDPSGHSLAQRIEYLKTGINIVKSNIWFGVGTGDVQLAFNAQYVKDNSKLKPCWRHRTHNQFITIWISFGIFGFLWFLIALFAPPYFEKQFSSFLFTIFFLIAMLSMLNEDTLETHVGVSFFAFFYSFFLFSLPSVEKSSDDKN